MKAFDPKLLPLGQDDLDPLVYMESLIDAVRSLAVYREKLRNSKLGINWFLPTLQHKEAIASAKLEGTQVTLNGVLEDQINPSDKDKSLSEVRNYFEATEKGYQFLKSNPMSKQLIKDLHYKLLSGNVRRDNHTIPGEFRTVQNFIGTKKKHYLYTACPRKS